MEKKLREMIKTAMINKKNDSTGENQIRYQTLKNILETAQKFAKEKQTDITDTMIFDAAKKEIKQQNDLKEYVDANNSEKLAEISLVIDTATSILPKLATEGEILSYLLNENIEKNMGVCMKSLKVKFGDSLDGKIASCVVKEYISK